MGYSWPQRYIKVHPCSHSCYPIRSYSVSSSSGSAHTLTGCDYTSKFRTKAAALKANPKMYLKDFGTMESDIENQVTLAEHYLVQVRKKGSFCRTSDELKNYFYHHVKSPDLPPTSQETRLHILRAFFATNQKKSCIYEGFDWCLGYSLF